MRPFEPIPSGFPSRKTFTAIIGCTLVYFIAARLSLYLAFANSNASPVWPPSGIGFAAVALFGYRILPGILLGACAANLIEFLSHGGGFHPSLLAVSLAIGIGNAGEAAAGKFLLDRFVGPAPLRKLPRVFRFIFASGAMSMVSAGTGIACLCLGGLADPRLASRIFMTWWIGDITGILVLTPLLLSLPGALAKRYSRKTIAESIVLIVFLVAIGAGVFSYQGTFTGVQPMAYAITPILIGIAFRCPPIVAYLGVFLISCFSISATVNGTGVFAGSSVQEQLLLLQAFSGVVALTVLFLTAALSERDRARLDLMAANANLERRVAERVDELGRTTQELIRKNGELEKARAQAEQGEERLKRLSNAGFEGLVIHDMGCIQLANQASARLFGYTVDEFLGKRLSEYIAPESVPAAAENMRNGLEEPVVSIGVRKDGSRIHMEVRGRPIDYNGKQMRVVAIRDITERLRADQIQLKAMEAIESANKAKSRFLATMSHEIRTPLNGILGMTVALENSELVEEQRKYVSILATCGQALLHQVNGILDLAKIESGSMALDFAPTDLEKAVSEALLAHGVNAKKQGLYWFVEKRMESANWVLADGMRLRQIIGNLAGNAVKFTESGGIRITVTSELLEGRAHFAFAISDTGIGIAPDVLKKLFRPFVQADASMSRRYGGSGLGLAICKQLAELLDGTLDVESQKGAGSTFKFHCTFESIAAPEEAGPGKKREKDWSPARKAAEQNLGLSVLVVEDDEINQEVAKLFLQRIGCEAAFAGSAPEAWESLKRRKYDLILMDCQLPGKDGLELTNEIRAEEPQGARTPIIAMTANAIQGDREACLAAGMDEYIAKPLDPANLLSTIKSVFERS